MPTRVSSSNKTRTKGFIGVTLRLLWTQKLLNAGFLFVLLTAQSAENAVSAVGRFARRPQMVARAPLRTLAHVA